MVRSGGPVGMMFHGRGMATVDSGGHGILRRSATWAGVDFPAPLSPGGTQVLGSFD